MQIRDWLAKSTTELKNSGIDSARLDCLLLLQNVLSKNREWLISHDEKELAEKQIKELSKKLERRKNREPLAYIIGSKEFYGRNFIIDKNVLIPRPESEDMIDLLLSKVSPCNRVRPCVIVDVGTGSGCLAITAKLELPEAEVVAVDISDAALKVARKNAQALGADIKFINSDLLSNIQDQGFTVCLANLPYVPDYLITSEEITKEPALALFAGNDGLDCYRKFWKQASGLKNPPLVIITESLKSQHHTLEQLALSSGYSLEKTKGLAQLFIPNQQRKDLVLDRVED